MNTVHVNERGDFRVQNVQRITVRVRGLTPLVTNRFRRELYVPGCCIFSRDNLRVHQKERG
jgi:hypothetical protein